MKAILRATAAIGASSAVAIAAGLVTAKACALLLGPDGVGLVNLYQSLLGLVTMVAGAGVTTAFVRDGARALGSGDRARFETLRRGAALILYVSIAAAGCAMTALRVPLSRWTFGDPSYAGGVALLAVAVAFNLALNFEVSVLNAAHRVAVLAKSSVVRNVLATAALVGTLALFRRAGLAPALVLSTACGWAVSRFFTRRAEPPAAAPVQSRETFHATTSLLGFGFPFMASALVGTGVQLLLPMLVLRGLGVAGVGFYAAAATIAQGYIGLLLNSLGQDYYPRVASACEQPQVLVHLVHQQQRVLMLLGAPMILGLLALGRPAVEIVYSREFLPALEVLGWQLAADLVRFSAWPMSYVVLARGGSVAYFFLELLGGATLVATSVIGMRWLGLAGLGMASLVAAIVYYAAASLLVRRMIGLRWELANKLLLALPLTAALLIQALPLAGWPRTALTLALTAAVVSTLVSARLLAGDLRTPEREEPSPAPRPGA